MGRNRATKIKLIGPADRSVQIKVPLISALQTGDAKSQNQVSALSFDNTTTNTRRTTRTITGMTGDPTTMTVGGATETVNDPDGAWPSGTTDFAVQRIDKIGATSFGIMDLKGKTGGQDHGWALVDPYDPNVSGALPPTMRRHQRYYTDPPEAALPDVTKKPDGVPWILMECYDRLPMGDAKSHNQESEFILNWTNDNADIDQADGTYDADPNETGDIDKPWILDLFQNPVDASWEMIMGIWFAEYDNWPGNTKTGTGLAEIRDAAGKLIQSVKNDEGYRFTAGTLSPDNKLVGLGLSWAQPTGNTDPDSAHFPVPNGTKIIRIYDNKGALKFSAVGDANDETVFTDSGQPIYFLWQSVYYIGPQVRFGGDGDLFVVYWKKKMRDVGDHFGVVEKYVDVGIVPGGSGGLTTARFTSANLSGEQLEVGPYGDYTGGISGISLGNGGRDGGQVLLGDAANGGILLTIAIGDFTTAGQGAVYWIDKHLTLVKKFGDATIGKIQVRSNMSGKGDVPMLHWPPAAGAHPQARISVFDKDNHKTWTSDLYPADSGVTGDFRVDGSFVTLWYSGSVGTVESWGPAEDDGSHKKLWSFSPGWSAFNIVALGGGMIVLLGSDAGNPKYEVYATVTGDDGKPKQKKTAGGSDLILRGAPGTHTSSKIKLS